MKKSREMVKKITIYKKEEHFDPFTTQDSVDYCKYYYTRK